MAHRGIGRLTQDAVERALRRDEPCTLRDGGGLLLIRGKRKAGWYHEYRLSGRDPATGKRRGRKLMLLGDYRPSFRLADARRANDAERVKVTAGHDVLTERHATVAVQLAETDSMTIAALIRSFVALRSENWRPNTAQVFSRDLRDIEEALGALPVKAITRARLATFLQGFVAEQQKRGKRGTRAERIRMLIGALFGHAIELDLIDASPAVRLRLPASAHVRARERTLDAREIAATWQALEGLTAPAALVLQLALVTGARIGAIASATESELQLDGRLDADTDGKPVWRIPPLPGRKAKTMQVVPLSDLAVSLWHRALARPGRNAGDPVFPGKATSRPLHPLSVSESWGRWRATDLLPADANAHDLRRSARSWWSKLSHGQSRDILERLLGHAVGGKVERVYDRALYLPQQRAVADAWAAWLIETTATPTRESVLAFPRRA